MSGGILDSSDDDLQQIVLPPDYNSSSSSVGDFDFDFDFDEDDGIHSLKHRQKVIRNRMFKQQWERLAFEVQIVELVRAATWVYAQRSRQPLPPFPRNMQLKFSPLPLRRLLGGCALAAAHRLVTLLQHDCFHKWWRRW
jgi:hypothetical protein